MFKSSQLFNYFSKLQNAPPGERNLDGVLGTIFQGIKVEGLTENKFNKEKLDRIYDYPANYKEAQIHKIATKYGYKSKTLMDGEEVPICPCCENKPSTLDIPICYSTHPEPPADGNPVFLLKTGVAMYFNFIKMAIIYLVLRFLIVDIFAIIKSIDGHYCSSLLSPGFVYSSEYLCSYSLSGYNLKSPEDESQLNMLDILNLILTVVSIVYFILYRKASYKLQEWLDYNDVTQDDFSVLIENIPKVLYSKGDSKQDAQYDHQQILRNIVEDKIRDWFEQLNIYLNSNQILDNLERDFWKFIYHKNKKGVTKDEIVTSITLCYDLTEMENMNNLRDEMINQCVEMDEESRPKMHSDQIQYIPNQIDLINTEYMNLCYKFAMDNTPAFKLSHFTGKAFVSFQYEHYKEYFLKMYSIDSNFLKINKKPLVIHEASNPNDIYWYNMKVSDQERRKNVIYSSIVLLMLLVVSFGALLGMEYLRTGQSNLLIVAIMATLMNVINFFLSYSIDILSTLERHTTKTNRLRSLLIKNIITQTINTCFIYYILHLIQPIDNPLTGFGLANKVISLVIISGFISVAMQIFIPYELFMSCLNSYRYSENKSINLFQFQLNQALQHPQFDFSVMYTFYIVFTYVVSFYGFLVPTATPILIVIFFIQFWVDKYNLFRRFSYSVDLGTSLYRMILKAFELSMVLAVVGHFIWDSNHIDEKSSYKVLNLISLGLSIIYTGISFFAPRSFSKKAFLEENNFQHHTYSYFLENNRFAKTYYRQSPATSCLKEAKIAKEKQEHSGQLKKSDSDLNIQGLLPSAPVYRHQVPDPVFVSSKQFDKYLNLQQYKLAVETYDKRDVETYENLGNADFDELALQIGKNGGLADIIAHPSRMNDIPAPRY